MNSPGYKWPGWCPEYRSWAGMKQRCLDSQASAYQRYGGAGVTVCKRWCDSYTDFLADMGHKPGPEYSLDRYPNAHGNYEPGNVRWATPSQQARNKPAFNVNVTLDGETRCVYGLTGWLIKLGVSDCCYRLRRNKGMSPEEALTAPKIKGRPRPKLMITHEGSCLTPEQWSAKTGIHPVTIRGRIKKGWPVTECLTAPVRPGGKRKSI